MRVLACMITQQDKQVSIITNKHSVLLCGRLNYFFTMSRSASPEDYTPFQLQLDTKHFDKLLLVHRVCQKMCLLFYELHLLSKCNSYSIFPFRPPLMSHVFGGCATIASNTTISFPYFFSTYSVYTMHCPCTWQLLSMEYAQQEPHRLTHTEPHQ